LKNRINTFLGNHLCRGVDELCTTQLRDFTEIRQEHLQNSMYESEELFTMAKEANERCFPLLRENERLVTENDRPEALQFYIQREMRAGRGA
jgi:hypothetical protein